MKTDILFLTNQILPDGAIIEYKSAVYSTHAYAINIIRDIFTEFRDFFGGSSKSYNKVMNEIIKNLKEDLKNQALELNANAIIDFRISISNIGSKNTSLFAMVATGTAVILDKTKITASPLPQVNNQDKDEHQGTDKQSSPV